MLRAACCREGFGRVLTKSLYAINRTATASKSDHEKLRFQVVTTVTRPSTLWRTKINGKSVSIGALSTIGGCRRIEMACRFPSATGWPTCFALGRVGVRLSSLFDATRAADEPDHADEGGSTAHTLWSTGSLGEESLGSATIRRLRLSGCLSGHTEVTCR